jgi:hypothetical protein
VCYALLVTTRSQRINTIKCRIKSSNNPRLTKIVVGGACKSPDITMGYSTVTILHMLWLALQPVHGVGYLT